MTIRLATSLSLILLTNALVGQDAVSFNEQIRPILSSKCFQCHGPDEQERKASLRLDTAEGEEGAYRTRRDSTAIQVGAPENSEVWHRINSDDSDELMPPPESKIEKLTTQEKALIKKWISEGANYEAFWAFVPPKFEGLPPLQDGQELLNPIDQFVRKRLEKENLNRPLRPVSAR